MKIFYGVQGTGNGHITRARVMARELYEAGIEVDFQFTGRPAEQYFEMDIFKDYQVRTGLTFNTHKGQVKYLKTALEAKPRTLMNDINSLDLSAYDLVISDFEPVTSWAGRKQKRTVLGIGHQYAFNHTIPREGSDPIANQVMKYFAPAHVGVGLHWHHFGQPILPPVIETPETPKSIIKNKIIVYLPFEDQNEVVALLAPFTDFSFQVYAPVVVESKYAHIVVNPLSRDAFQKEALQLGKKILAKPLHAQMEQISNAAALKQLGYGQTMNDLDASVIKHWLQDERAIKISYPNIAKVLVQWIQDGMPTMDADFIEAIWNTVNVEHISL